MTRRARFSALLSLLVMASSASLAHADAAQSELSARARALGDQIDLSNLPAPGGGVEWGRAEGVVRGRVDDVVAVLSDYARYAGLFPYFQKSKVLSQRGSDALVYLEAKVLHGAATLWGQVRMSQKHGSAQTQVIEAKLMKGKGNISQLLARWEVTPVGDGSRTHVVFQLLVDPDLPVPDLAINREMKKGAGQAFRALRDRVYQRASIVSRTSSAL